MPGATQDKWSKLDIGKDVTLKIKAQDFNPSDVKEAAAVFDEARSLIDAAYQAIQATNHAIHAETWSQKIQNLALHYFSLTTLQALDAATVERIKTVIFDTRNGLLGAMTLKLGDLGGTRAKVPVNTRPFLEDKNIPPKRGWRIHVGLTEDGSTYCPEKDAWYAGIRFDRSYLLGEKPRGGGSEPSVKLRAKTLIHECTHRFANTEDHAYYEDDGGKLDETELKAPKQSETKKWLATRIAMRGSQ